MSWRFSRGGVDLQAPLAAPAMCTAGKVARPKPTSTCVCTQDVWVLFRIPPRQPSANSHPCSYLNLAARRAIKAQADRMAVELDGDLSLQLLHRTDLSALLHGHQVALVFFWELSDLELRRLKTIPVQVMCSSPADGLM